MSQKSTQAGIPQAFLSGIGISVLVVWLETIDKSGVLFLPLLACTVALFIATTLLFIIGQENLYVGIVRSITPEVRQAAIRATAWFLGAVIVFGGTNAVGLT